MVRVQSLLLAAMLLASATAFAADTPDPNATGEAAVPSGSNANAPTTPPAGNTSVTEGKGDLAAPATTPGEENKGKPPIKPE